MDWLFRFFLGFKARPKDASALLNALPELSNEKLWYEKRREILPPFFEMFWYSFSNKELLKALKEWALDIDAPIENHGLKDNYNCPSNDCPLRNNQINGSEDSESGFLGFMVAAGGPKSNLPKKHFLDLVRKTHSKHGLPEVVIITDPYIYSDVSEDKEGGGFSNLVEYLETLGLSTNDKFTLQMTPIPKRGTKTAKDNLQRHLKKNFKCIEFKDYSPTLKFHDRFYVVRYKSGKIRGVFGPSINGLNSDSIVLMGDIDGIQTSKKLKEWFDF